MPSMMTLPTSFSNTNTSGIGDSLLRPPCSASARLREWLPSASFAHTYLDSVGHPLPLSVSMSSSLDRHIQAAWADSTLATYGSGLLAFHAYCDIHHISDTQRAPASPDLLSAFVSSLVSQVAPSTIVNYVAGLWAWLTYGLLPFMQPSCFAATAAIASEFGVGGDSWPEVGPLALLSVDDEEGSAY